MDIYADVARTAARGRLRLRVLLHQRGARRAARRGPPAGRPLRLRRPLPRPDRRADGRLPRRGPRAGRCGSGCPTTTITFDDLVRGEITFDPGERARLRHRPGQRRPALHPGQPGRRRADGDHPRPARRGPALLDPAADRAVRGACRDRRRHRRHAALRPPAVRHGRGQQEAVQARPARPRSTSTASAASCPRGCSTTSPCSAGRSPTTATSSRWTRWSPPSTSPDVNANPARFDLKKCEAINAVHLRELAPAEFVTAVWCRSCSAGCCRPSRPPGSWSCWPKAAPLVQERMVVLERGASACWASCSSTPERLPGRRGRTPPRC